MFLFSAAIGASPCIFTRASLIPSRFLSLNNSSPYVEKGYFCHARVSCQQLTLGTPWAIAHATCPRPNNNHATTNIINIRLINNPPPSQLSNSVSHILLSRYSPPHLFPSQDTPKESGDMASFFLFLALSPSLLLEDTSFPRLPVPLYASSQDTSLRLTFPTPSRMLPNHTTPCPLWRTTATPSSSFSSPS
jgi:hypothetical protein